MRALFIKYTVLFSKAGLVVPAMLASAAASGIEDRQEAALAIIGYLEESKHPSAGWILDNFTYHLAGELEIENLPAARI